MRCIICRINLHFTTLKNQDSQVRGTNILAIVDIVKKPKNKSKIQINSSDILRNCF